MDQTKSQREVTGSNQTSGQLNNYWSGFWHDRKSWEDLIASKGRPSMNAFVDKASTELTLTKLHIDVSINGIFAKTTFLMTFFNDSNQKLSGELVFPLPDGAVVSGFGLDIDGEIVDGVCVEKQKARIAFEKEVRKGVDPGLIEKVQGNNFKTRVYPIEAHNSRQVKIEFTSDLTVHVDDKKKFHGIYTLPIDIPNSLKDFQMDVDVNNSKERPFSDTKTNLNFSLDEKNFKYRASIKKESDFQNEMMIIIPDVYEKCTIVEKGKQNPQETYFCICDFIKEKQEKKEAKKIQKIGIIWDSSFSRSKQNLSNDFEVVQKVLSKFQESNEATFNVEILTMRHKCEFEKQFEVKNDKDIEQTVNYLKNDIFYDGGTNLGSIPVKSKESSSIDFYLLFSDGIGNLGKDIPDKQYKAPIYGFGSELSSNHKLLSYICEKSGGIYNNLKVNLIKNAVDQVGSEIFGFLDCDYDMEAIDDMFPCKFTAISSNHGRILFTGKLLKDETEITCNFGYGSTVTESRKYKISKSELKCESTSHVQFRWAENKISELEIFSTENKDEILSLGKEFSIVTSNTSLMVLETLEQHLEHKIVPAKSRKQMYEEYMSRINLENSSKQKEITSKLQTIKGYYTNRKAWYNQTHQPKRVNSTVSSQPSGFGTSDSLLQSNLSAPPPPSASTESLFSDMNNLVASQNTSLDSLSSKLESVKNLSMSINEELSEQSEMLQDLDVKSEPLTKMASSFSKKSKKDGLMDSKTSENSSSTVDNGPSISVKAWDPNTPYLSKIKEKSTVKEMYVEYINQRKEFKDSPAFYLDCAEFFFSKKEKELGIRIISCVVELELENVQLFRALAYKMESENEISLATYCYEKILELRPEYPQPYRDLALIYYKQEKYEKAVQLLYKVLIGKWDQRFSGMEAVAHMELNHIISKVKQLESKDSSRKKIKIPLDDELTQLLDCDIRVVFGWDSDDTCIDLWVTEPDGSKCYYGTKTTQGGGFLSRDIMEGLGPNEYFIKDAYSGEFQVTANYYSNYQQSLTGFGEILEEKMKHVKWLLVESQSKEKLFH
eukprot:gene11271-4084_t